MTTTTAKNQLTINKDMAAKKIVITREFDAAVEDVWAAWTRSDLLDQWWAPKPWRAQTKSMNFSEGGRWLYAMVGPDGASTWCKVDFEKIVKNQSFSATDAFCDEHGNENTDFPAMFWKNTFTPTANGTKVTVEITFKEEADIQKILELGFQEGFTAALGNLDELLASGKTH